MPDLATKTMYVKSCSESETIELGIKIGTLLEPGDCVYLYGDMGTGKTRIAKGLIHAATNTPVDEINSPTFTIINRYEGDLVVYHADFYRIEQDDIEDIGIEMVEESRGILVAEWAEKVTKLAEDVLRIYLNHTDEEDVRMILVEWAINSSWSTRLRGQLPQANHGEPIGCKPDNHPYLCNGESICRL